MTNAPTTKYRGYFWLNHTRYYGWGNGRVTTAMRQEREDTDIDCSLQAPQTVTRPYYIGSESMVGAREQGRTRSTAKPLYSKATLEDAVQDAQQRLIANPRLTEVSIVKIVRVVRRAKPVPPPSAFDIEVVG